jgi:hypothetical protein
MTAPAKRTAGRAHGVLPMRIVLLGAGRIGRKHGRLLMDNP